MSKQAKNRGRAAKNARSKVDRDELIRMLVQGEADDNAQSEELLHLLLAHRISDDIRAQREEQLTIGQRLSDSIARFVGSWSFILSFCLFLVMWMVGNLLLGSGAFDPYPYILLNLVLSCVAAIQAPLIMMSQNRQEEKDRLRSESDYKVNLKSELIVEDLHRKLDEILERQAELERRLLRRPVGTTEGRDR